MDRTSKQILVMRKSFLVDGKKVTPRKGKYIAQGAHAALKAILDRMIKEPSIQSCNADPATIFKVYSFSPSFPCDEMYLKFPPVLAKVCCCVETEEELLEVFNKANDKGLITTLIKDKGLTEFNGIETITCCAIGPAWSDELNGITDKLELF